MARKTMAAPERIRRMREDATTFFDKHKRPDLALHGQEVLSLALDQKVVEPNRFGVQPLNITLAELILCHTVDCRKLGNTPLAVFRSEHGVTPRYDAGLKQAMHDFCELRELDYELDGNPSRYAEVLAKPTIALPARIADLALLTDHTVKAIYENLDGKDLSIFHRPPAGDEHELVRALAAAAFKVYAPFGELLGYRGLVSRIRESVFVVAKPEYYSYMIEKLRAIEPRINETLSFVRTILTELEGNIAHYNRSRNEEDKIKYRVKFRPTKSVGSILEKMDRRPDLQYDLERLNDLVAFTIITENENDVYMINRMFSDIMQRKFERAESPFTPAPLKDYVRSPKPNGYRSLHNNQRASGKYVNFESIFRTEEMEDAAENGAVAHAIYKGDASLHGNQRIVPAYNALIDALSTPEALDKVRKERKGLQFKLPVIIIGTDSEEKGRVIIDVFSRDIWVDAIALALKSFATTSGIPIDRTMFEVIGPKKIKLSDTVPIPEGEPITLKIKLATRPLVTGNPARNMVELAQTPEGAILASKLAKLRQ